MGAALLPSCAPWGLLPGRGASPHLQMPPESPCVHQVICPQGCELPEEVPFSLSFAQRYLWWWYVKKGPAVQMWGAQWADSRAQWGAQWGWLQSLPQLSRGVHVPFHMAQSQSLSKIAVQGPSHSYSKQRSALTGIPCAGAPGLDDKGLVRSVSWCDGSTWPVLLFFCTHPVSCSIRLLHSSLHFSTWSPENPTCSRTCASVYTFCLYSTQRILYLQKMSPSSSTLHSPC